VQVLYDIRELYVNNLASLLREFGDGSLQQDIAEVLYAKDPERTDHTPVAFVRGSKRCPSSVTDCISKSRWPQHRGSASFTPILRPEKPGNCSLARQNNCLYVPVGDFDTKYREYARRAFKKLLRVQEENLSEDQLTWLTTNESAITERIDRFIETGHHERI